jgi:hypothetical protein
VEDTLGKPTKSTIRRHPDGLFASQGWPLWLQDPQRIDTILRERPLHELI